jgi:RNA-directed DNA polymerase
MSTKLDRITERARIDRKLRFSSLAHIIDEGFLRETWGQINRKGAGGVDGQTMKEYEKKLDININSLHRRLRSGAYRAAPVRRVEIPKDNGKVRALGIPTVEDRLVQRAVARVLMSIYEQDFLDCSYGFRPKRKAHDALRSLRSSLIGGKIMHVYEADIRSYFDHINHKWLMKMLEQRISDRSILRLIGKWLKAGVMHNGVVTINTEGAPQGGSISPVLSNVYLHYVLDLWFERVVKPNCRGDAHLVRFADDFVVCFQYQSDVNTFASALKERMQKFNLTLAPEKTKHLVFGRFAKERLKAEGKKTEEFIFLGFRHICGVDRVGKFALVRLPSQKSCRKFLDRVKTWLKEHRHWRVADQRKQLESMLLGFYQYFALTHCGTKLLGIYNTVLRYWWMTLKSRSQRGLVRSLILSDAILGSVLRNSKINREHS